MQKINKQEKLCYKKVPEGWIHPKDDNGKILSLFEEDYEKEMKRYRSHLRDTVPVYSETFNCYFRHYPKNLDRVMIYIAEKGVPFHQRLFKSENEVDLYLQTVFFTQRIEVVEEVRRPKDPILVLAQLDFLIA